MILNNDNIILDTDPRIRLKSEKVALPLNSEDKELLSAMLTYVRNSTDEELAEKYNLTPAVGIAAIQVGVPKAMLAVVCNDDEDEDLIHEVALANPRIISRSVQKSYLANGEGCLSVPDVHEGHIFRNARIKVRGYDLITDKEITFSANGFFAIALQHEIDHLSGVLYYDHIDEKDPWKEDPTAQVI
jgi:peptide deformylase